MTYNLQMVLLWRDPEGKRATQTTVTVTRSQTSCDKDLQLEKMIATLEKTVSEKDSAIMELKDEIKILKGVGLMHIKQYLLEIDYMHVSILYVQNENDVPSEVMKSGGSTK